MVVPAQTAPLVPDGKLWNPSGGHTYTEVLVLIGTWTSGQRLTWRASQRVAGDPKRTTRGLIEPTLAEFTDGRLLMVMRGSNGGKSDPQDELPIMPVGPVAGGQELAAAGFCQSRRAEDQAHRHGRPGP